MSINDSIRRKLVSLARQPRRRETRFEKERPTRWNPRQVRNPEGGLPFTNPGAWDLIASKTENGHQVEIVELQKPKGATGYVMLIELEPEMPLLYVKLELKSDRIFGRSFHYSTQG